MVTINRSNGRRTRKVTPIRIWIPPKYSTNYRITIQEPGDTTTQSIQTLLSDGSNKSKRWDLEPLATPVDKTKKVSFILNIKDQTTLDKFDITLFDVFKAITIELGENSSNGYEAGFANTELVVGENILTTTVNVEDLPVSGTTPTLPLDFFRIQIRTKLATDTFSDGDVTYSRLFFSDTIYDDGSNNFIGSSAGLDSFTVEEDIANELDLTDFIDQFEFEDGVSEFIGKFKFRIWNPNETYTNLWTGNEIVRLYSDYDTTATTLRFRGRIEKPIATNNQINVRGRTDGLFLIDKTVTQSFENVECSEILKSLNTAYGEGRFTTNNIASSGVLMTVNWNQKSFFECVKEITDACNFEAYIDADLDWNFFLRGSRVNTTDGIMENYNIVSVGEFGPDLTTVKNRYIIYGALIDGVQIIYTAEDIISQNNYGVKEVIVSNDNVKTYDEAKELGEFLLSNNKDPKNIGDVTSIMIAGIQPGEQINIGSPPNGLNQRTYPIRNYKHTLSDRGLLTQASVENKPIRIPDVVSEIISRGSDRNQTSSNPFEMRFAFNDTFNIDTGTHTNTEITQSLLRLIPGQASGNWISERRESTDDITQAYLILNGSKRTGATVSVSNDDGTNYTEIDNKSRITFTTLGKNLRVKIEISDTETEITSISIQYKTN